MPNRILRDWTDSERVNALSANAEVFFVRLIMKADDYGRFHGNPQLLKSYLYPLKDIRVADITRWIAECEKSGLIANYEVSGKRYLEILNFNQRLRMKSDSKFPSHDGHMTVTRQSRDSNVPTCDSELPLEEEARSEKREKKMIAKAIPKENGFSFADFPENLKCDEFLAKWREWEQYRKKTHKTVSAFAAKKQLNELAKWDVQTAMAMIDESIKNDWQGIFPLKQTNNTVTPRYGRQPLDEEAVSKRAAHLREVFGDDFEGVEG